MAMVFQEPKILSSQPEHQSMLIKIGTRFSAVPNPFEQSEEYEPILPILDWSSTSHSARPGLFGGKMDRKEIYRWYMALPGFTYEATRYVLPRLLVDLLWYYPDEARYSSEIIEYLHGPEAHFPQGMAEMGENPAYAQYLALDQEIYAPAKEKLFSEFASSQKQAVLDWLVLASSWTDSDIDPKDISVAIEYWRKMSAK
jgi:hypothetical protein